MVLAYLGDTFGITRHTHILEPGYELSESQAYEAQAAFARMAAGEPLQYVTGRAHFYGRPFNVTPAVLIPRPETELLCRTAIDAEADRGRRVLDMCTGSGCIAWTMALECPGTDVVAVDISDAALTVASSQDFNEEMSRTGAVAPTFFKADVLDDIPAFSQCFDVILSNPPYVMDKEKTQMRTNVLEHEPHLALFVSDDDPLLFYRAVACWASELLSPDGFGLVEINEALGTETAAVFLKAGFQRAEILKDLNDKDRFIRFSRK